METHTITLTESQIFQIQLALSDSALYWFDVYQQCRDGERDDISQEDALKINKSRWELHAIIRNL